MVFWDDYFAAHGSRTASVYTVCMVVLNENLTTLAFPGKISKLSEINYDVHRRRLESNYEILLFSTSTPLEFMEDKTIIIRIKL